MADQIFHVMEQEGWDSKKGATVGDIKRMELIGDKLIHREGQLKKFFEASFKQAWSEYEAKARNDYRDKKFANDDEADKAHEKLEADLKQRGKFKDMAWQAVKDAPPLPYWAVSGDLKHLVDEAVSVVYAETLDEMVTNWVLSKKSYPLPPLAAEVMKIFLHGVLATA